MSSDQSGPCDCAERGPGFGCARCVKKHPALAGRLLSPVIFCECGCGGRRCTYCGVVGETTECATCAEVAP